MISGSVDGDPLTCTYILVPGVSLIPSPAVTHIILQKMRLDLDGYVKARQPSACMPTSAPVHSMYIMTAGWGLGWGGWGWAVPVRFADLDNIPKDLYHTIRQGSYCPL